MSTGEGGGGRGEGGGEGIGGGEGVGRRGDECVRADVGVHLSRHTVSLQTDFYQGGW
jgi:hypothetical protein